ncbi:uncharacterized protein LOC133744421 [Rosa rugosa]|uniref:uncharacterized protein LOC133744421 n=1 Tax=Rosa rugosa TaxID=74645 RepID=UPI002B40EB0F|nr:uncharacterized protein LOC133744421 [Rosa rugosa]
MNVVALFLVVTSLVSAGIWSPSPDQQNQKKQGEEVIVKNGHRVVVVEYEDQQGHNPNTKVSISADQDGRRKSSSAISNNDISTPSKVTRALDNAMENIKEAAASVLPNRGQGQGQGLSKSKTDEDGHHYSSPKELICDAYGKCKYKIANALETKKDILKETAHEAKETAHKVIEIKKDIDKGIAHEVKETAQKVGEAVEDAYDAVSERAHQEVGERAKEAAHKAKDTVGGAYGRAKDTVEDAYERAKGTISDTTHEVEERAKESVDKAMNTAKTAKEMGQTLSGDVQRNVSKLKTAPEHVKEKAKEAKETVEDASERAKETMEHAAYKVKAGAEDIKDVTDRRLNRVFKKGRDILYGVLRSMGSLFPAVDPLLSGLSLFGFATAYGMSMWITFASSYLLSRVLSPHQFGMVQSKIYKVYFAAMASTVGMALLGHLLNHWKKLTGRNVDALQNYNLLLAELMVLFNMLHLEPRSTKVMFEKLKLEKEEGRGREHVGAETSTEAERHSLTAEPSTTTPSEVPEGRECEVVQPQVDRLNEAHQRLNKLNSYSSILNILSLMALTWHLVYLAKRLQSSCC